jgi:hypothetical protein
VQFQHMFASKGSRCGKIECQTGINQVAIAGVEIVPFGKSRLWQAPQQLPGNIRDRSPGHPHDSDASLAGRGGNGGDSVDVRGHVMTRLCGSNV